MVGQWAFALYDRAEKCLWLARDRFGEKPLFYYKDDDALTFASSIAALLEAPWITRELDTEALLEYLTIRYVVAPRTVVANVHKVPAGHLLCARPDGVEVTRWYTPRFQPRNGRRRSALIEEFDELFAQASERCLVSDVPVALLLSDGIDSNSIHAALAERGKDVPTFTFTPTETASRTSGSEHVDFLVSAQERIEKMVPAFSSFTEPTGDGAALATWFLIRNGRSKATVFLCGHGGDEVLGGYRLSQDRFRLAVVRGLARLPLAWTRRVLERHLYGAEPVAERRRHLLQSPPNQAPDRARYIIHRPLPAADITSLYRNGGANGYLGVIDRLYSNVGPEAPDIDRMQEVLLHTFLSENILCFADAMAMDSSAELRMPFLDRDLVEFILSLPPAMRVGRWPGRTNTKRILRWWGAERVAHEVLTRRKRHFNFGNLPELLQHDGDTLRERILGCGALRSALPGLEDWLSKPPEAFRGPWEGTLWALLALGIWCEHNSIR
jgi:asparagine synthase (glutamine-hydrolysing)